MMLSISRRQADMAEKPIGRLMWGFVGFMLSESAALEADLRSRLERR